MNQKIRNYVIAVSSVVLLVLGDQVAKILAVLHLNPKNGGSDVVLWDGVFRLRYLENRGAAFGLMQGQKVILVITTLIVFFAICWIYRRIPNEKRFTALRWIAVFVMAGAIGNFIDRMRLGYVVDFFYFELINFPIFNVADIYVTCSVILFILLFLFYYKDEDLERILPSWKKKVPGEASGHRKEG